MNAHDPHEEDTTKKAAVNGLAVVGVVALIIGGMLLIIYGARYIPETLERLAGAVYLSPGETVNEPEEETPVPPTGGEEEPRPTTPATTTPSTPTTPRPPVVIYPTGPTTVPVQLYGTPDLTTEVLAVGRLQTSSANSFVSATRIDEDDRAAIRFRVRNVGTNQVTGWQVEVRYPAASGADTYLITSYDTLRPNGYKDYTFGFDDPDEGSSRSFAVTVDPANRVYETREDNNRTTATINVGTGSSRNDDLSCDLRVSPSRIDEGDRATLRWDTEGATSASINQGIGSVDEDGGSERVSPRRDTTYRMTVRGGGDTETCSVTLRVDED